MELRDLLQRFGLRDVAEHVGLGTDAVLRAAAGVRVHRATGTVIATQLVHAKFRLEGGHARKETTQCR